MGVRSPAYLILFLLHLTCVVVGFGSSFVYPALARRARALDPREAYAINHTAFSFSRYLTSYPIYAAGVFGLGLVMAGGEDQWKFSQTWVSVAMLLFVLAVLVVEVLHYPNLRAMDGLQRKLVEGEIKAKGDGPPKEVAELKEHGAKAGMYGGILHLFFILLMIDMIWKPGFYIT